MPIYMDHHIVPGVTAIDAAEAHRQDILIENEHRCKCMTYWIDEARGNVFCLIEAPSKDAVVEMHGRAHGLVPHRIIEVESDIVYAFLGRISDPEPARLSDTGMRIIDEPSLRFLLVLSPGDAVLLQHRLGQEKAHAALQSFHDAVSGALAANRGRVAAAEDDHLILSFVTPGEALLTARDIRDKLRDMDTLRISMTCGEPVSGHQKLFGEAIRMGKQLCLLARDSKPLVTYTVREKMGQLPPGAASLLSESDESFIMQLFTYLDSNDQAFSIDQACRDFAMSKSQFYRRVVGLSGMSPLDLVNTYRLHKAKSLLRKGNKTVAETCFESGFTAPSYFTKCFKKQFGLLPLAYASAWGKN